MSEILDLLPIPEERDFPAAHCEARRDALVAAVRADSANAPFARRMLRAASRAIARSRLLLLGVIALGIPLLMLGVSSQRRPVQRDAVAVLAVAGTAQVAIAVAPKLGLADATRSSAEA